MASYGYPGPQDPSQQSYNAQNLQFYPSSYGNPVSGHSTPAQAQYGGGGYGQGSAQAYPSYGGGGGAQGFMSPPGYGGQGSVSRRMGEQGGLRTGWIAAFGTEGYEGEPPLLEELGVNFGHIKVKTLTVLNPFGRIDRDIILDADLFGPIIFILLFGTFLLLAGKINFGYIYGIAALGSVSLHWIFSLMSNPQLDTAANMGPAYSAGGYGPPMGNMSAGGGGQEPNEGVSTLTFFRTASVLGYCLLPLVLTSCVGVAMSLDGAAGYILTSGAVAWCSYSSSGMFCVAGRMTKMRPLIMYPLVLFYTGFGIMGIFSSRGSGQLAARAGL